MSYSEEDNFSLLNSLDLLGSPTSPSNVPIIHTLSPSRVTGKTITELQCKKLSKRTCVKIPTCSWNDSRNSCIPALKVGSKPNTNYQSRDEYLFEIRRQWRNGITSWLSNIEENIHLKDYIQNIKILTSEQKASSSDSIIMTGLVDPTSSDKIFSLGGSNIIMKVTFEPIDIFNNSLEVEIAIYKNIITALVNDMNTPNVMSYLGFSSMGNIENKESLPVKQLEIYDNETLEIRDPNDDGKYKFNLDKTNILTLERSSGVSFNKWANNERTLNDVLSVIFQVIHALLCISNIGLRHNDLHPGNIFIEDIGEPVTMFFARGGDKYIELTTRWIPKIYDFDRGVIYHPAVPRNTGLDIYLCGHYGTCNGYNPKFDLYTFLMVLRTCILSTLDESIKTSINDSIIKKTFDPKWLYNAIKASGIFPHLLKNNQAIPTDSEMLSVKEVLQLLLETNWTSTPWILRTGDLSSLPKELLWTPPPEKNVKKTYRHPISTASHPNHDLSGTKGLAKDYRKGLQDIIVIWAEELDVYGYKTKDKVKNLYDLIKDIIKDKPNFGTNLETEYSIACWLLVISFYHTFSLTVQKAFTGPRLSKFIDNIWNMFSNEIPVDVLFLSME